MNFLYVSPVNNDKFKGILSCGGWSGGKLAFLLGTCVTFPNRNEDLKLAWQRNTTRKRQLSRAINLGCRKKFLPKDCLNYNSEFTQDKLAVWEAFDKIGIPHPMPLTEEQILSAPDDYVFLGRQNRSSRGRGIVKYTKAEWLKVKEASKSKKPLHDFYVEFLQFKSEHRVHILNGEVVCTLNKVVPPDSKNFIHTAEQGFPLSLGDLNHPEAELMCELSKKSVAACGLELGAVDLFVDEGGKIYVLEVNSDPGMPGHIGFLYAQLLSFTEGLGGLNSYNLNINGEAESPAVKKKRK